MKNLLEETHREIMQIKAVVKTVDEKLAVIDSLSPVNNKNRETLKDIDTLMQLSDLACKLIDSLKDRLDRGLVTAYKNEKSELKE